MESEKQGGCYIPTQETLVAVKCLQLHALGNDYNSIFLTVSASDPSAMWCGWATR